MRREFLFTVLLIFCVAGVAHSQCSTMVPGYINVGGPLEGCAPLPVSLRLLFDNATPGTQYQVNWGDGSGNTYSQVAANFDPSLNKYFTNISHMYATGTQCDYEIEIQATNACNAPGDAVTKLNVAVWTPDVVFQGPTVRVCVGYQASWQFWDNGVRNCFPKLSRANDRPRWISWEYGVGPPPPNRINGVKINGLSPVSWPYFNPNPLHNPYYPVLAVQSSLASSLPMEIPATTIADIGKEFWVKQRVWNQCNAYDNNLTNGPRNPISGNIVEGDNPASIAIHKFVIVSSPESRFDTYNAANLPSRNFCIGEMIVLKDITPFLADARNTYTWEFFDQPDDLLPPIATTTLPYNMNAPLPNGDYTYAYSSSGPKLIRFKVKDVNAIGNCEIAYEIIVNIEEPVIASIEVQQASGDPLQPFYCADASGLTFNFYDVTTDATIGNQQWRWDFFAPDGTPMLSNPAVPGAFSPVPLGPYTFTFTQEGSYVARLTIRDVATGCTSVDEQAVTIYRNPIPDFTASEVCFGTGTSFQDITTFSSTLGATISSRDWDLDYDGVTFNSVPSLHNIQNFTRTYSTPGYHTPALQITSSQGCSAIIAKQVLVGPIPVASFTPASLSGCGTMDILFDNTSTVTTPGTFEQFVWELDNGNGFFNPMLTQNVSDPGFTLQPTLNFPNTGSTIKIFRIRLRAVTTSHCENTSAPVVLTSYPNQPIGITNPFNPFDKNCSPFSIDFEANTFTQSIGPSNYHWEVTDPAGVLVNAVDTGTDPRFSQLFANTGISQSDYTITLSITSSSSCPNTTQTQVRVNPLPDNNFKIDTVFLECDRMRLKFEAVQTGLVEYIWKIQVDGVVVDNVSGSLSYERTFNRLASDQNITVTLETKNYAFCENAPVTQSTLVPALGAIIANFSATPLLQALPNSTVTLVNLTNAGTFDYEWDFGDGETSTDPNVGSHTYAGEGVYRITLKVSQGSCYDEHDVVVVIEALPPFMDFTYTPSSGCAPLEVQFTNLSENLDETTYEWDFGPDIARTSAKNPLVVFDKPGFYTATLTAKTFNGVPMIISKAMIIEVFENPLAFFKVVPNLIYIPEGKAYMVNSTLGAVSYQWNFGDGGTSTDMSPVHIYEKEGQYTITLKAISAKGCLDSMKISPAATVRIGGEILFANAFTPGNSGGHGSSEKNNFFKPLMRGVREYHLQIFNRWGTLLFETRNADDAWNGTYKGELCPSDVYVYKVVARLESGQQITKVGDVNLIR